MLQVSFKWLLVFCSFVSLNSLPSVLDAQDDSSRQTGRQVAASYINDSTLMLAEIDWTKLEVEDTFKLIQRLTGDRPSEVELTKKIIGLLESADAGRIYVLADSSLFRTGVPLVVVPCREPSKLLAALKGILGDPGTNEWVEASGNALLLGAPELITKAEQNEATDRDDLLSPLSEEDRLDHVVTVSLPDTDRKTLSSIWRESDLNALPIPVAPKQLLADIERLSLSLRMPPNPAIRLRLHTSDEAASSRVKEFVSSAKAVFGDLIPDISIREGSNEVVLVADTKAIDKLQDLATAARDANNEQKLVQTLKHLGLAVYNYENREKHLPPRCFVDKNGVPMHSWMVAVLPDFEQLALYRSIRLDKPWDAPENSRLSVIVPAGVGNQNLPVAHTTIRAPVFPGSLWHGSGPPKKFADIKDDLAGTILLADAPDGKAIHWADPEPWIISESNPMDDFFADRDAVRVLLADGAVLLLERKGLDNKKLAAMLTIAGDD